MNFHQKLVVYYILDYFGILFILDINSMLIEFILWDQRLSQDKLVDLIERTFQRETLSLYCM